MWLTSRFGAAADARGEQPAEAPRLPWMPFLALAVLCELAALAYLLPRDPDFAARLDRWQEPARAAQHARYLAALMRGDPRVGARVLPAGSPVLRAAFAGRPAGPPALLVFVGGCTPCTLKQLPPWAHAAKARPGPIALVSWDTRDGVIRFLRAEHFPIRMLADPMGRTGLPFHVAWIPRAYAVGRDGRLAWIQRDDKMQPADILDAAWGKIGR